MDIQVKNLQKKITLNPPQIIQIAKTILLHEGIKDSILSLVFVSSQKIRALNKKFLNRTYSTDVLAFDLCDMGGSLPASKSEPNELRKLIGDIVISTDAIKKNSQEFDTTIEHELSLYVIHGILHLLGYDDHKPADIKNMRAKEKELLTHLGSKINKTTK